ncbi:MAG: hypothetical protein Ct9H300mP28_23160 [Pseudomonadota bacterium]|nr:MAG: hypothetical protein Ct9H300mP28_23160 [Pseudomonadota bacterium]
MGTGASGLIAGTLAFLLRNWLKGFMKIKERMAKFLRG